MKRIDTVIRKIRPEEHGLLREFLYQAIYLPEGAEPPPRSVVDLPELQVYVTGFGTQPGDHCLVAETELCILAPFFLPSVSISKDSNKISTCSTESRRSIGKLFALRSENASQTCLRLLTTPNLTRFANELE